MVINQKRSKRKPSGGRYHKAERKRLRDLGRAPTLTKLGERKLKIIKTKGCGIKKRLFSDSMANVYNPKSKKCVKAKIKAILENPANRQFVRSNIMTKGTIIETEIGKAKITGRPGQDGAINALLI